MNLKHLTPSGTIVACVTLLALCGCNTGGSGTTPAIISANPDATAGVNASASPGNTADLPVPANTVSPGATIAPNGNASNAPPVGAVTTAGTGITNPNTANGNSSGSYNSATGSYNKSVGSPNIAPVTPLPTLTSTTNNF